jgi:excisionase family DNA binding protein
MTGHEKPVYGEARLEPLLTINDVATVLAVSRDKVYGLIREGALEPIRVGHHARFAPADIRTYLARSRKQVSP